MKPNPEQFQITCAGLTKGVETTKQQPAALEIEMTRAGRCQESTLNKSAALASFTVCKKILLYILHNVFFFFFFGPQYKIRHVTDSSIKCTSTWKHIRSTSPNSQSFSSCVVGLHRRHVTNNNKRAEQCWRDEMMEMEMWLLTGQVRSHYGSFFLGGGIMCVNYTNIQTLLCVNCAWRLWQTILPPQPLPPAPTSQDTTGSPRWTGTQKFNLFLRLSLKMI